MSTIPLVIWLTALIPVTGIVGALLVRAGEGSPRYHGTCLAAFFTCLIVVAGTAMWFLRLPSGLGLVAGFTFGLMLIGTTCDFRRADRVAS